MAEQLEQVREVVRERYAQAAGTAGCGTSCCSTDEAKVFGPELYAASDREALPDEAQRIAAIAKALGDPVRLQLVDVLRRHAGEVCVCELVPLFDLSQPTVSHHLKVLRDAGVVGSERRGLWAYYYVKQEGLEELDRWLSSSSR